MIENIKKLILTYLNFSNSAECVLKSEMNKPHLKAKYIECL